MFHFDQADLAVLPTSRRALIAVDFQNDFIAADGALPVLEPAGYVDRTVKLAEVFRECKCDVFWVTSAFEQAVSEEEEPIIVTDDAASLKPRPGKQRGRRPIPQSPSPTQPDVEAFLSHQDAAVLKVGSGGCDVPSSITDTSRKTDMLIRKSNYSAFHSTQLLKMLRARMDMEIFICGSLANVGVYATAMDAAGHGLSITVVEDCCGYRRESRQIAAVRNLIELAGCEIGTSEEVLEMFREKTTSKQPQVRQPPPSSGDALRRESSSTPQNPTRLSESPGISQPLSGLRLASNSPNPQNSAATSTSSSANPSRDSHGTSSNIKEDVRATPQSQNCQSDEALEGAGKDKSTRPLKTAAKGSAAPGKPGTLVPDKIDDKPAAMAQEQAQRHRTSSESSEGESNARQGLCSGDTNIIEDLLPSSLKDTVFAKLRDEVKWQRMSHQGGEVPRLVAVQGDITEDGSVPIYRHPSDESPPLLPFSPTVLQIKAETEKHLGHPLNHVLIQHYRDGNDYISEHSDKTLDIVKGSYIANVSLGAERTMVLRTKRAEKDPSRRTGGEGAAGDASATKATEGAPPTRQTQRARLPHNSLCRMGLKTNMEWLHSIRQDKRAEREKTPAELAYQGGRISLTFRRIGTFMNKDETMIWGQGAVGKTRAEAQGVINGQSLEAVSMLRAFGTENHSSSFDWDAHYGGGFNVLHMSNAPRFFAGADPVANMRVVLILAEHGISYAKGSIGPAPSSAAAAAASEESVVSPAAAIKFVDNDEARSVVQGEMAIMLYLDACRTLLKTADDVTQVSSAGAGVSKAILAKQFSRFQKAFEILPRWQRISREKDGRAVDRADKALLDDWEDFASESVSSSADGSGLSIAGPPGGPSLADFAFWPVLHSIMESTDSKGLDRFPNLKKYYENFAARESVAKVLRPKKE